LIADPDNDWMNRLLIDHENSFLHKKNYLDFHPSWIEVD
jgi:hypothetical protein